MNFTDALNNTTNNISYTENGMQGYKSTNNPYLDFLYKVSSFRGKGFVESICTCYNFLDSIINHEEYAKYLLKFIVYIRDPRNGLGERALGRELIASLFNHYDFNNKKDVFIWTINNLCNYGRWDDLIDLFFNIRCSAFGTEEDERGYSNNWQIINCLKKTLENDLKNMENNTPITLLAKWMPSINTSSANARRDARYFARHFKWSEKEYRQNLSKLRKYLKVTERKMSLQEWDTIDYEKVPSLANLRYKDAFLKHDKERREEYLSKLAKGEVKINSSVNFPYDVVHKYSSSTGWAVAESLREYDQSLEQLWKNLKEVPGLKDTLVVRDDSGSMTIYIGRTSVTSLEVATALGIYCAEHCSDAYKNKIISFSKNPKYLDFSDKVSLHDKLDYLYRHSEFANTNIRKVFQLILKTAIDNKLQQEELPKQILIISDMEFDEGADFEGNPIEEAQKEFEKYGYKVPKLIFWNVNSRTNTVPIKTNELGVYLLSGFSPNVLNILADGLDNQFEALAKELERKYKEVPEIVCN